MHLDRMFNARVAGPLYAQPLYWHPSDSNTGVLFAATEHDVVQAFDATTGKELWRRAVGRPVRRSLLPCGDINPLGITGTPVIDPVAQAIYFDAAVEGPNGPGHEVFGLSLKDGSVLPGRPIDIAESLQRVGRQAVFRVGADLRRSENKQDYFAPSGWKMLDAQDEDLGASNPLPLNAPNAAGGPGLMLALGKDRKAYLLDRNKLGSTRSWPSAGSISADTRCPDRWWFRSESLPRDANELADFTWQFLSGACDLPMLWRQAIAQDRRGRDRNA